MADIKICKKCEEHDRIDAIDICGEKGVWCEDVISCKHYPCPSCGCRDGHHSWADCKIAFPNRERDEEKSEEEKQFYYAL